MKDLESATRVQDSEGRQYHIGLKPGEMAPYILFLGDPDRAERVAEKLDTVELRRSNREFHTVTGEVRGVRVSAMGTGTSAAAKALNLLAMLPFPSAMIAPAWPMRFPPSSCPKAFPPSPITKPSSPCSKPPRGAA